jgi:hypothetical protein
MERRTIWEQSDQVGSGMRLQVTAAAFSVGGQPRGAVTVTVEVPEGYADVLDGGGLLATILLDPEEALGLREWLREAAEAASAVGPGLYESS